MLEDIKRHNEQIRQNILKGFNSDLSDSIEENSLFNKGEIEYDELQKAVYADTAENRKLGRVGQEYHREKGKKQEENTTSGNKDEYSKIISRDRKKIEQFKDDKELQQLQSKVEEALIKHKQMSENFSKLYDKFGKENPGKNFHDTEQGTKMWNELMSFQQKELWPSQIKRDNKLKELSKNRKNKEKENTPKIQEHKKKISELLKEYNSSDSGERENVAEKIQNYCNNMPDNEWKEFTKQYPGIWNKLSSGII